MKYIPRHYQKDMVDETYAAWDRGVQRPAVVACTGSGKTIVFSALASREVREFGRRPLILVHREELAAQAAEKLRETDPGLTVGIIKAERHEVYADVVVASVATLCRRLGQGRKAVEPGRFNTIITDEAHHGIAASYQNIYRHFGGLDEDSKTRMLGVSATLSRSDGIGLGALWQEVVYEYGTTQAMEEGFLVPAHAERVVIKDLDLSQVKSIGGDWSVTELGGKLFQAGTAIADAILEKGRRWDGSIRRFVSFAPTVAVAHEWSRDFTAAGLRNAIVQGETPTDERNAIYRAVASGELNGIVNCMICTEGWDCPSVELVHIGRPTKSIELFTQMVGRGLRLSPATGKRDCMVLDTVGTINTKLRTLIDLGLPSVCECACSCAWAHLCGLQCDCPRDKRGKLKVACVVCAKTWRTQTREDREPCYHYDRSTKHVVRCRHTCSGLGRPGQFDPDEEHIILDPEEPEPPEPIEWDNGVIVTEKVELFERIAEKRRMVAPKPPRKQTAWMRTYGGREFLPPAYNYEYSVFLHEFPSDDGSGWSVGELAMKGRTTPKQLASGLTYEGAKREAEDSHPSGGKRGREMPGLATEGQLALLAQRGIEIKQGITKQEASDAINVELVSKRLGE